jgi:hypothetical protein
MLPNCYATKLVDEGTQLGHINRVVVEGALRDDKRD